MKDTRIILDFSCTIDVKLFKIDVKNVFLNGYIQWEMFVDQTPGFINSYFPDHVFKLQKTLYGLKQDPRAWYDYHSKFLLENSF